jgi:hypothetical protein
MPEVDHALSPSSPVLSICFVSLFLPNENLILSFCKNKYKPIVVPKEFEIMNGISGMNKSIIIRIMKNIGYNDKILKSVYFILFFFFHKLKNTT